MKIMIIHRYFGYRGAITPLIKETCKIYDKKGIDYEIICQEKFGMKTNNRLIIDSIRFYTKAIFYLKKNEDYDLIVTHSNPIALFKFFINKPVILFVYNLGKEEGWVRTIKDKFISQMRKFSFKLADKLVAASDMIKEILQNEYKINKNNICVITSGVNKEFFKPKSVKHQKNKIKIMFRGLGERKGFHLLKEWIPNIIQKNPNIIFELIGENQSNLIKENKNIKYRDFPQFQKLPDLYNEMDIVILPSTFDPFPGLAIEAMGCGKAVIVSEHCGTKQLIKNNENGIISSLENFPKEIIRLSKNKSLIRKLGKNARKTILKEISWEKIVENQVSEFNKVLMQKTK